MNQVVMSSSEPFFSLSCKVLEFFELLAGELQGQPEWKEWFVLPFVKNPETMQTFEAYFNRGWPETLALSLTNLLSTVFQSIRWQLSHKSQATFVRTPHFTLLCLVDVFLFSVADAS
jgi:hypothetical protein